MGIIVYRQAVGAGSGGWRDWLWVWVLGAMRAVACGSAVSEGGKWWE